MTPISALITTFNLFAAAVAIEWYTNLPTAWLLVIGSAAWAAYDARTTQPWRYRTGLANHPPAIFVGVLLLWLIVFPWYLIVRGQIRSGRLRVKDESGPVVREGDVSRPAPPA